MESVQTNILETNELGNIGYNSFVSSYYKLILDSSLLNSSMCLIDNELFSVNCNIQYFLFWIKKKNINTIQLKLIELLFATINKVSINFPLNPIKKLILMNIDIRSFRNFILDKGLFSVFDFELNCYIDCIEYRYVKDNPAPAIGNSKLVYSYRGEVFHERILELY